MREIGLAGLLHDIGVTRIPIEMLSKSDQLAESEREMVRQTRGWRPTDLTYSFINERSGFEFDPDLAGRLIALVKQHGVV